MDSSTVQPIHMVKESLYIKLKYWTETWAHKWNENAHNTVDQGDQFGCQSKTWTQIEHDRCRTLL